MSLRDRFLLFSSGSAGAISPFKLDLRTGLSRQLCETRDLNTKSLCLDENSTGVLLQDGVLLKRVSFARSGEEVVADGISVFSAAGSTIATVQHNRLVILGAAQNDLAIDVAPWCLLSPDGNACLFSRPNRDGTEYWQVATNGPAKRELRLATGAISNAVWSPTSDSVLLLRDVPGNNALVSEIHEVDCRSCTETRVSGTSQFGEFSLNHNGTVFVGASRSKAQPTVNILLRSAQREMTLCEHRASHATSVQPVFSPDSRRVYFETDREGSPAIYVISVEQLVEPTESGAVD